MYYPTSDLLHIDSALQEREVRLNCRGTTYLNIQKPQSLTDWLGLNIPTKRCALFWDYIHLNLQEIRTR